MCVGKQKGADGMVDFAGNSDWVVMKVHTFTLTYTQYYIYSITYTVLHIHTCMDGVL